MKQFKKPNGQGPRVMFPREEFSWRNAISRCHNPNSTGYKNYGGRGIKVCQEWRESFDTFYSDMGKRPVKTSLDRLDNTKGYYKGNCRWATSVEQNNNKTDNVILNYNGICQSVTMWAKHLGIKVNTLQYRLYRGWSIERALTTKKEQIGSTKKSKN